MNRAVSSKISIHYSQRVHLKQKSREFFLGNDIAFIEWHEIPDGPGKSVWFDFYLPEYDLLIDYIFNWSFRPEFGEEYFMFYQNYYDTKNKIARENGMKLIEFYFNESFDEISQGIINEIDNANQT